MKRSCVEKHKTLRCCRGRSSPRGNVVVERRRKRKHICHTRHFCCVPIPNVLVERRSSIKHSIHSSHLHCVPTPNVLVERRSGSKHIFHISHFRCVPIPNGLVERRSLIKHSIHSSHFSCVPLRNVAVECTFTTKALKSTSSPSTHIFHRTRIPIRHRAVIITRCPSSALAGFRCFF